MQENLVRGGIADHHRDRRSKLRSVRALRDLDSKVALNKCLWGMTVHIAEHRSLPEGWATAVLTA